MTSAPALDPARDSRPGLSVAERSEHRMLRAEKAQLAHWRRLLRARLDLVVAGLAPPERLGVLTSDLLPEAVTELPQPGELLSAVAVPSEEDTVDLMNRIRRLDRALRAYAEQIDAALEQSTRTVIHDLAEARPAPAVVPGTAPATPAAPGVTTAAPVTAPSAPAPA